MAPNAELPKSFKQWVVKARPKETLVLDDVFELVDVPFAPGPHPGHILVKIEYLSHDPAQRGWISHSADANPERHYTPPIGPGEPMRAMGVGTVVATWEGGEAYAVGDKVLGVYQWADYVLVNLSVAKTTLGSGPMKLPPGMDPAVAVAATATAWTAYFGLWRIAEATGKERTIVVSTAAGATGSWVCQFAKNILGIERVIGITGSDAKCEFIKKSCGVDIALNYKSPTYEADFLAATPDYIDIYWDNVGGETLNMALERIAKFGHVVSCGSISQYGKPNGGMGITGRAMVELCRQSVTMRGFIVLDFKEEFPKAFGEILGWIQEGKAEAFRTVVDHSIEQVPQGMLMLIQSENTGKLISKVV